MEKRRDELLKCIDWYKEKIEYNAACKDMCEQTREFLREFGNLDIPAQAIIELRLVDFMKSVSSRFIRVKKQADVCAKKWQQEVDQYLRENNMTEKNYLQQLDMIKKLNQPTSPRLNGTWKAGQRISGSDDRQNYRSSSSCEDPDWLNKSINHTHGSNHRHFDRKSFSPLHLEAPVTRSNNPAEFNANLSIDPKEVIPSNKPRVSPLKKPKRFHIDMEDMEKDMFRAVKTDESAKERHLDLLLYFFQDRLNVPAHQQPSFLRKYAESVDGDSSKSLNGKTEKKIDPTHMPHTNSQNMPSTLQQGAKESSRSRVDSKQDKIRKHMENAQSVAKAKDSKEGQQSSQECKNLPCTSQQGAVLSSGSHSASKHDRKKKLIDSILSERKEDQQPARDSKHLPSTPQQGVVLSSCSHSASKHDRKLKNNESNQTAFSAKELKEEQQPSQDHRMKHRVRAECVVKGKEISHSVAKADELKEEYQPTQVSKLKDAKRVCAMALEAKNWDKNHIKRKESPDQSAMVAITSSKKERTSVYHGRRAEMAKLKNLCISVLVKAVKQSSDIFRYINKNAEFEVLEPILVHMCPEKLHRLEEEKKYLKIDTDNIWQMYCKDKFRSQFHLKRQNETWRTFYQRCCMESKEKLRNVTASISASASKAKPNRQIMLTTVDGPPTKRHKTDHAMVAKKNANNSAIKLLLPNFCHPSNSRNEVPVPPKVVPNHINKQNCHRTIKKGNRPSLNGGVLVAF